MEKHLFSCLLCVMLLLAPSCRAQGPVPAPNQGGGAADKAVASFEDCVAAGNAITKSLPPQCRTPDGRVFVKGAPPPDSLPVVPAESCVNRCGDGVCQEIVCMALGCPCAETPQSCPADCGPNKRKG